MTTLPRTLLIVLPALLADVMAPDLVRAGLRVVLHGRDPYVPGDIDYVLSFRPPHGLLKSLTGLKAVLSLGAGVDGFLGDPDFPADVPLVRFIDPTLSQEMAQYVVLHVLLHHRQQRLLDEAQRARQWRQTLLPRRTSETRIGILGLGEIGNVCADHLLRLGFALSGWSRARRSLAGVRSYAGDEERDTFLAQSDVLVCLLPLTPETRGVLNARLFATLPKGAYVINVARGGHLVDDDLIQALDSGHLSGAALDVFHSEPLPPSSPLWSHPRIIVTPHVAAISDPAAGVQSVLDSIARLERGSVPAGLVDLHRGY